MSTRTDGSTMTVVSLDSPPLTPLGTDPVVIAYGALADGYALPSMKPGECARCAVVGSVVALRTALSSNFTAWDNLNTSADGLCPACCWSYNTPALRTQPVLVHRLHGALWVTGEQIAAALATPFTPDVALSAPVRGRKHLLPSAEWGAVSTDDGPLVWTREAAELTRTIGSLRVAGVREQEFSAPTPPARLVAEAASTSTEWLLEIMRSWERIRPWTGAPHFEVAVHGTRALAPNKNKKGVK